MQRSIAEGWDEFERGHDGEARHIFEELVKDGRHSAQALLGLARLDYRNGSLDRAERRVQEGIAVRSTPELEILAAQLLGERGKRTQAESALRGIVSSNPENALARAIYAEQILRQGRWEDGTNQFIAALSNDPDGYAFQHFRKVTADLVDALIAGRMPEKTAMQFINRVAYSIPTPDQEMNYFFGEARRAVTGRQALERQNSRKPAPQNVRSRLSRPDLSPQARAEPARRPRPSQPAHSGAPTTEYSGSSRSSRTKPPRQNPSPPQPNPANPGSNVDANIKNVRALIQKEKELNRDLLSGIPAPDPLQWPSQTGYATIDTVPAVLLNRDSLLGHSSQIDTFDFRVTTGSLASEIFLERCLRNLLVATQENKAVTLVARPDSVWQMEMNCRDGLLDKVLPPSELYAELEGYDNYAAYSLAMFLGHSLATTHDATWSYGTPASKSYLELGETTLKPFDLVARWIADDDKESVNLDLLSRLARQATKSSTSMSIRRDYIDPTRGVHSDSLPATLANLWTPYLFSLSDAAFSEITESIVVEDIADEAIVFTLSRQWAPDFAAGPSDAGIRDGDRIALAYLRESGEFIAMATRKGFAAYMEATSTGLNEESARRALNILATAHCPSWHVATNKASAQHLSQRASVEVSAPQLHSRRGQKTLEIHGLSPRGARQWRLIYNAGTNVLIPWEFNLRA